MSEDVIVRRGMGLSARLLLLTLLAVMAAEILIFLPSVANFREKWLMDRLEAAQIVALAAEDSPTGELSPMLQNDILNAARVRAVAIKRDIRRLIAQDKMPTRISAVYDLRDASTFALIRDAVLVYFHGPDESIRVIGQPEFGNAQFVEIVVDEAPLRSAMITFGLNILALSIVISLFAAGLVYLALNWLLVQPMMRMVRSMEDYATSPEDTSRIIAPSKRTDEIGFAERELAKMQGELSQALTQKNRLASLGLAVSKINHDLRNMLANAQLISDRFALVDDPTVQRFAPKLINALDRAVHLCTSTLKFGKAEEAAPQRTTFDLRPLVEEIADQLGLPASGPSALGHGGVGWSVDIESDIFVHADREQLYRVLSNLVRNAAQVVSGLSDDARRELEGRVDVSAEIGPGQDATGASATGVLIHIRDTGPGFPLKAREHLFEAFQGSARKGGTGLGLAIADELVRVHGGRIRLCEEDTAMIGSDGVSINGQTRGAHFEVFLPERTALEDETGGSEPSL